MADRQVSRPVRPVYGRPPGQRTSHQRFSPRITKQALKYLLWIGVGLFVWHLFAIKNIKVTGNKFSDPKIIAQAAKADLTRLPWGNNLLTMDSGSLKNDLLGRNFRLKTVEVRRHLLGTLEIRVTERQPSLNWQTGGQVYTLDVDGSIIGPAEAGSTLPVVVDTTNLPVKVGDKVVPPHFIVFCGEIVGLMPKRAGLTVSQLKVPDTTSEVYAVTNRGFLVKFDTTREASGELDDLSNVLATLKKLNKNPAEYIDLRVENKAYYR